jgi:Flp pilus assembly protein TadG
LAQNKLQKLEECEMSLISMNAMIPSAEILRRRFRQICGTSSVHGFAHDRSGNISMFAAFSLLPLFTCVGMGVDYGRAHYVKTRMQASLDSAVLAGGRTFQLTSDSAAADTAARNFFDHRFANSGALFGQPQITSLTIDTSRYTITADAGTDIPTPFLGIAGIPTIRIGSRSASALSSAGAVQEKDLEISLVLDITGSMNDSTSTGTKIDDAKLAAKDLVDIIMPTGYVPSQSTRIALVPFSQYVNVGSYYQDVTNQAATGGNTCVTERTGADAFTDKKPGTNRWIGAFSNASNHASLSCKPVAQITPLTSDKTALKSAIDGYTADGWTAGHLGTAWGWYMLSHDWNNVWPAASAPKSAGSNVHKITVIMTDGDYNTYYRNNMESQDQAASLCQAMKADLTVYTIGFGSGMSPGTKDFLKACASTPSHYFDAENGGDLRNAFRSIAISLSQLRLTQ